MHRFLQRFTSSPHLFQWENNDLFHLVAMRPCLRNKCVDGRSSMPTMETQGTCCVKLHIRLGSPTVCLNSRCQVSANACVPQLLQCASRSSTQGHHPTSSARCWMEMGIWSSMRGHQKLLSVNNELWIHKCQVFTSQGHISCLDSINRYLSPWRTERSDRYRSDEDW